MDIFDITIAKQMSSEGSGGDEMLVVGLTQQIGSWEFTTDKTYDEIAESIYNGNYNIVLVGSNNVAGGQIYHLRTVNYGSYEKYGGISNIEFFCLLGSNSYMLRMLPTEQNVAAGTVTQLATK